MRIRFSILLLLLLSGLLLGGLVGCAPSSNDAADFSLELSSTEIQEGQRAVRLQCATCHGVGDNKQDEMLAPSLWAVRQHYIKKYPDPDVFVAAMLAFLDEPTDATGLMPQAIEHYGLMAMLPLAEAELSAAVRLIAVGHVTRPAWARAYDKEHAACYDKLAE